VFSGKYGAEKRKEKRIAREMPFDFFYHGQNFKASTVDSSKNGLCVTIFGRPPVISGDTIDIAIKDLLTRANVVWMKKEPDKCLYGLKKLH